jgi:hypothetical protein
MPVKYVYQPDIARVSFSEGMRALAERGHPVVPFGVDMRGHETLARIRELGEESGITFRNLRVDRGRFERYVDEAGYHAQYADYYRGNQVEKSFEHYVSLELLRLTPQDVFIDIASEHSPVAEIYARLTGATVYSQDIMYADGIVGSRIGGDACAMPVPDGFATKACLTCSLEHFEGDGDTRLFLELGRVLRPGGSVCVIPFYVYPEVVAQTDPTLSVPAGVAFDPGVPIYCAEGWGNRHARFYSPASFAARIIRPLAGFAFEFFSLANVTDLDPSIYARFAFLATRR